MPTLSETHQELRRMLTLGSISYREYTRHCKVYGIKPLLPNGEPLPENIDGRCVIYRRGQPTRDPDSENNEVRTE